MVGDENEGVKEMPHHTVERRAVRETPVTTATIHYITYTCIVVVRLHACMVVGVGVVLATKKRNRR